MSTPIDFDGDIYDEPISDADFRVGAPRTRWGWTRALKKLIKEETKTMFDIGAEREEAEKTAIELGRKCQDLENQMSWDEYKQARGEWVAFRETVPVYLRFLTDKVYWQERDRGLTGN